MVKPFYAEHVVTLEDGDVLRLAIDFEAIDATETLLGGTSYPAVLQELGRSDDPPLGFTAKVVWGMLRKYHPLMTVDEVMSLMWGENGLRIGLGIQKLLDAAFPVAEPPKEGEEPRPPEPRGASDPS